MAMAKSRKNAVKTRNTGTSLHQSRRRPPLNPPPTTGRCRGKKAPSLREMAPLVVKRLICLRKVTSDMVK